jgi:hypothetical protein
LQLLLDFLDSIPVLGVEEKDYFLSGTMRKVNLVFDTPYYNWMVFRINFGFCVKLKEEISKY